MVPSVTASQSLLSANERAAIAEIEATTSILQLVTRLTAVHGEAFTIKVPVFGNMVVVTDPALASRANNG